MIEATIRAQVELQYALDRMCTPLHASRLSGATAAEDARCMTIIRAEIDRLTRERDEARAERDALAKDAERYRWLRDPCSGAERVVMYGRGDYGRGLMTYTMLDEAIDAALAQIEQERSEQKEGQ